MKNGSERVFEALLKEVADERYVHSLSELTYNNVSSLWHISSSSEKELARIAARVICGIFCLKYLSHIDRLIKKKHRIKGLTDRDLSDPEKASDAVERFSEDEELRTIVEEVLPALRELVDSVGPEDLEKLTQMAHTGDYLLAALDDLRRSGDDDYRLWLLSIPHYYEKDLESLRVLRRPGFVEELERFVENTWKGQIPIEALSFNMRPPARRINLNPLFTTRPDTLPSGPRKRIKRAASKRRG